MVLQKAEGNRYKCTECNEQIKKDDKLFRDTQQGWRSSHTVNICWKCITKMFFELNIPSRNIPKLKREFLAEQILNTPKEKE